MWSKQCVPIQILASFGTSFCLTIDFSYGKKEFMHEKKGWKKTTRFCRCFLPVTILINSSPRCQYFFPTGRHSLLDFKYFWTVSQPRHARESFVYCAIDVELLSLQIVEIERHNYLLDYKYSFSRLQIAPSHEQKITILPQTESSKGKKERQKKIAWRKGRKKPQGFVCFLPHYWWTFSCCKYLLDHGKFYFSTLQQLSWCSKNYDPSTNGIKERKRKETDFLSSSLGKISSSSGLPTPRHWVPQVRSLFLLFYHYFPTAAGSAA